MKAKGDFSRVALLLNCRILQESRNHLGLRQFMCMTCMCKHKHKFKGAQTRAVEVVL